MDKLPPFLMTSLKGFVAPVVASLLIGLGASYLATDRANAVRDERISTDRERLGKVEVKAAELDREYTRVSTQIEGLTAAVNTTNNLLRTIEETHRPTGNR